MSIFERNKNKLSFLLDILSDQEKEILAHINDLKKDRNYNSINDYIIALLNRQPSTNLMQAIMIETRFIQNKISSIRSIQKYLLRNMSSAELKTYLSSTHNYSYIGVDKTSVLEGLVRNPAFISLDPVNYILGIFYESSVSETSKTYVNNLLAKNKMSYELAGCILYHQTQYSSADTDYSAILRWARKQNPEWADIPNEWLSAILKAENVPALAGENSNE